MPTLIRQALFEKLQSLAEWHVFRADFQALTGLEVAMVDDLGLGYSCQTPSCQLLSSHPLGHRVCQQFRRELLEKVIASGKGQIALCDAGSWEVMVPLQISGNLVGFLIAGGAADGLSPGRITHLLRRTGVLVTNRDAMAALGRSLKVPARVREACLRWLELAAREMAAKITAHPTDLPPELPKPVETARKWVRAHAFEGPIGLADAAKAAHVSPAHLSRLFRHSTGLSFTEYVARLRATAARDMLLHSSKSVTEVAFESGFSSLSQFHRVFRRIFRQAPRCLRSEKMVSTLVSR